MGRLLVILFVCFSLMALSAYAGRVASDRIIHPDSLNFQFESPFSRTVRQSRPVTRRPQTTTTLSSQDYEDIFGGLDPNQGGFNNNNNQQFSNNNNNGNQRPNQQQQQGFGNNRPQGQNSQWSNNNNNGDNQEIGNNFNNRPSNQNQGQGFSGNNFNNRPTNQNQGQGFTGNNFNNRPTNQNQGQGFTGNNFNNRPTNENQNQEQTSNELSETERNACNNRCKEIVTNEYNPVCGTDSVTYQNRRFLECAATNCGIQTQLSYIGSCMTTTGRTART